MQDKRNILVAVIVRTLVCVGLLGGGIGILTLLVKTKPQPARSTDAGSAPRVIVMPARAVELRRQWEGFGTARAMDTANVPARVTATVIDIPPRIEPGVRVEAGELLVALDDTDFIHQVEIATHAIAELDAQLDRMEIELASWTKRTELATEQVALAQADFERFQEAARQGGVRPGEMDRARQAIIVAIRDETIAREELDKLPARRAGIEAIKLRQQSEREVARDNLDRCRITSPLAGVVAEVDIEVGESLTPGQRVARVVNLARIEVPLRVPARARGSIRVGDDAVLRETGGADRRWTAPIARIAPDDDSLTRTVSVYVVLEQDPDAAGALAPGQFVRGRCASATVESRSVVPRRALQGDRVLLVRDGRIDSCTIDVAFQLETTFEELGVPDEQWVVLGDPLADGELVVIVPTRSLIDGLPVEPVLPGGEGAPLLRFSAELGAGSGAGGGAGGDGEPAQ